MAKILVSLVSEQTIPNVLLIKELQDIDKYLLISTAKMEEGGKSQAIIAASGMSHDKFSPPLQVIEDSLSDVENQLKALDFNDDDLFVVNLTGGTKIMSIGVYNFFKNKQSQIFYIPIGKNMYRKIFPEVKNREFEIAYRLQVQEYLISCGIEIVNPQKLGQLTRLPELTTSFFQRYVNAAATDWQILDELRVYRKETKSEISRIHGLESLLARLDFRPNTPGILQKNEIKYLTGEWFEEYVYALLKQSFTLSETAIANSIHIRRKNVENEFDVMFTHGNALYVIECKTAIFDRQSGKNILNETLYKLAALRRDFGLFVKSYIFTLSEPGSEKTQIKQPFLDRSAILGIKIIDGMILKNQEQCQKMLQQMQR